MLLFGERGDPEDGQEEIKNQELCISAVVNYLMTKVVFEFVSLTQQGIEQRQKKKRFTKFTSWLVIWLMNIHNYVIHYDENKYSCNFH